MDADVIVVGAGLAGLVATAELADAGKPVLLLDQEPRAEPRRPGVLVASAGCSSSTRPEQRRLGIKDSLELALQDWLGSARLRPRRGPLAARSGPRPTSTSPPARSAPGCTSRASRFFPVVGWAERGGGRADGHGNSVPRFHITWGTGPGVVEPFERRVRAAVDARPGRRCAFRHRVDELVVDRRRGRPACAARCSSPTTSTRGAASSRERGRRLRADARRP